MPLSDTHLVLLSAAAQRDDKLLVRPDKLGPKAADKLAVRFEAAGLVEAIAVTAQQPHWRVGPDDQTIGLRIVKAGLETLGIEPDPVEPQPPYETTALAQEPAPNAKPPRGGKRALLVALLQREEGASVEAIMGATGWLAHSTRAALTELRKSGHQLVSSKDDGNQTIYRLTEPSTADGSPADTAAE